MYMACSVHSSSTGFTLTNRKEHSSCLAIARNLPPSSRAESYLVFPLHAKSKKSIVIVLARSLRKLLPLSASSWSLHNHLCRNSYFSTAVIDSSDKCSAFENDIHRVTSEDVKYLWLLATHVFRGPQQPHNPWPQVSELFKPGSSLQRSKAERRREFLQTTTWTDQQFCPSRLLPEVLTKNV